MKTNLKSKMKNELDLANLAPISVCVYSRLDHFKNCIESLAANDLAKHSVLYIFSDAAKPGDEKAVSKVRQYIRSIKGFKNVKYFFQKKNNYYKNIEMFLKMPFKIYDKIIILEDDNIVSKFFLRYMNGALNFYKDDHKITSIAGWTFAKMSNFKGKYDNFLCQDFNGWGVGFWSNRNIHKEFFKTNNYLELLNNRKLRIKIKQKYPNLLINLKRTQDSNLILGDYNASYYQIKNNKFQVKPFVSFVNNMGNDGSGMNCVVTNEYFHKKLNNKKNFVKTKRYDPLLDEIYFKLLNLKQNIFIRIIKKIDYLFKKLFNTVL